MFHKEITIAISVTVTLILLFLPRAVSAQEDISSALVIDAVQGKHKPISIRIFNNTDEVIILSGISTGGKRPISVSFLRPLYGSMAVREDKLYWNTIAQMATYNYVEAHGIILPRGTFTTSLTIRPLEAGSITRDIYIRYYKVTIPELAEIGWIPELAPFPELEEEEIESSETEFRDFFEEIYRHPTVEELKKNFFLPIITHPATAGQTQTMKITLEVEPLPFSLEEAIVKVGFEPEDYTYNETFACWILKGEGQVVLVSEEKELRFKNIDLSVFDFISAKAGDIYDVVGVWIDFDSSLTDKYENVHDPSDGHHIYVPRRDLLGVLKMLDDKGYFISIGDWYLRDSILVHEKED